MTFNSLYKALSAYKRSGLIKQFVQPFGLEVQPFGLEIEPKRRLFLSEEAMSQCPVSGRPRVSPLSAKAADNSRTVMEHFSSGEEIIENLHLKDLSNNLSGIKEVWALRTVGKKKEQARLFGYFFGFDSFLITHCQMRNKLKEMHDPTWEKEIIKVEKKRKKLFPELIPYEAGTFLNYLSEASKD